MRRFSFLITSSLFVFAASLDAQSYFPQEYSDEEGFSFTLDGPSNLKLDYKQNYKRSGCVDQEIWESVFPYLLPVEHPIKKKLDNIFYQARVTQNSSSIKEAGFRNSTPGKYSQVIVSEHPNLEGYLIKMYTDDLPGVMDWAKFKDRVLGAQAVQLIIDKYGYQADVKVPKKWLYPLPEDPSPAPGSYRKNFILIVEDMNVYNKKKSLSKWKGSGMTKSKLNAIYNILQEAGLIDCIYAFNIPFSKDGRVCFLDTEQHHLWPVNLGNLSYYLSKDLRKYWIGLVQKEGPK